MDMSWGEIMVIGAVAVHSTLRRSESAPDRVITVGIMVLLLAATDISVLWNSQLPFAGPAVLVSFLVAGVASAAAALAYAEFAGRDRPARRGSRAAGRACRAER